MRKRSLKKLNCCLAVLLSAALMFPCGTFSAFAVQEGSLIEAAETEDREDKEEPAGSGDSSEITEEPSEEKESSADLEGSENDSDIEEETQKEDRQETDVPDEKTSEEEQKPEEEQNTEEEQDSEEKAKEDTQETEASGSILPEPAGDGAGTSDAGASESKKEDAEKDEEELEDGAVAEDTAGESIAEEGTVAEDTAAEASAEAGTEEEIAPEKEVPEEVNEAAENELTEEEIQALYEEAGLMLEDQVSREPEANEAGDPALILEDLKEAAAERGSGTDLDGTVNIEGHTVFSYDFDQAGVEAGSVYKEMDMAGLASWMVANGNLNSSGTGYYFGFTPSEGGYQMVYYPEDSTFDFFGLYYIEEDTDRYVYGHWRYNVSKKTYSDFYFSLTNKTDSRQDFAAEGPFYPKTMDDGNDINFTVIDASIINEELQESQVKLAKTGASLFISRWNYMLQKLTGSILQDFFRLVPIKGMSISKTSLTMYAGNTASLSAAVKPSNATHNKIYWSSSDPGVATVSSDGVVSAVSEGAAVVQAYSLYSDYSASCIVRVTTPAKIEAFIKRLYTTCLGRQADSGGLEYWKGRIISGSSKGINLAGSFVFSDEFTAKNYCDEHFVRQMYKAMVDREADSGGLQYWVNLLNTGTTRQAALNSFASSQEYRDLCNNAGFELGNKIGVPKYGTQQYGPCSVCGKKSKVVQFVERMYTECLKRAAESGGLNYWSKELCNHTKTGKTLLNNFFLSQEIKNKNLSNEEYVRRIYRAMLNRDPDSGGLAYWAGRMNKGESAVVVIAGFVDSAEFTKICQDYGIQRK